MSPAHATGPDAERCESDRCTRPMHIRVLVQALKCWSRIRSRRCWSSFTLRVAGAQRCFVTDGIIQQNPQRRLDVAHAASRPGFIRRWEAKIPSQCMRVLRFASFLFLALSATASSHAQPSPPASAKVAQPALHSSAPVQPVVAAVGDPGPSIKVDCAAPADHVIADLCEQHRMADAAEHAVAWQRAQFWLSLFGTFGLVVTILYTAKATRAAADAATASGQAVQLSRRGFVGIKNFTFHRATWTAEDQGKVEGFKIVPVLGNMGTGPALITATVVHTRTKRLGDTTPFDWGHSPPNHELKILLGPGVEVFERALMVNLLSLQLVHRGELRVLYMFKHQYTDVFDEKQRYHSDSCFELRVLTDPETVFRDQSLSPSQYFVMEARGEYGSAS